MLALDNPLCEAPAMKKKTRKSLSSAMAVEKKRPHKS